MFDCRLDWSHKEEVGSLMMDAGRGALKGWKAFLKAKTSSDETFERITTQCWFHFKQAIHCAWNKVVTFRFFYLV